VSQGWKEFVMKLSYSAFSLGFLKCKVAKCQKDPSILKNYFDENKDSPEYIVQEAIKGFKDHWETRGFWSSGEMQYCIGNFAAVVTENGEEVITNNPPAEFRKAVETIGKAALDTLPVMKNKHGAVIPPVIVRTDIGCSSSKIHDKNYDWDPKKKTFFLNEIEYGGTNYFTRHLDFDCIPMWAQKYAQMARDIMFLGAPGKSGTRPVAGKAGTKTVITKKKATKSKAVKATTKKTKAKTAKKAKS